MNRTVRFAWLVLFGALTFGARAEVDHRVSLSVVQIRAYPGSGSLFLGSGVVVAPNRVATNCHVTRMARKVLVSKGPAQYPAISEQIDTHHDLCLLNTPSIPFPEAQVGSTRQLEVGVPLYFYGYPRGVGITFSAGRVQALHPFDGGRVIETSADFAPGGSGGGLFDGTGRLVGLATFLARGRAGAYFAVPSDWIESLELRETHQIGPFQGRGFWEDVATLPPFLKPPGR